MRNKNLLLLLSFFLFICDYNTLRKGLLRKSKQEAKLKFKMCHLRSTNKQFYICKQFSKTLLKERLYARKVQALYTYVLPKNNFLKMRVLRTRYVHENLVDGTEF